MKFFVALEWIAGKKKLLMLFKESHFRWSPFWEVNFVMNAKSAAINQFTCIWLND